MNTFLIYDSFCHTVAGAALDIERLHVHGSGVRPSSFE